MNQVSSGTVAGQSVRVFDLEQPRFQGMPIHDSHQPGYAYFLHRRHTDGLTDPDGPRSGASGVVVTMEHAGTHIDALSHQAENQTLYGGIAVDGVIGARGFRRHGVEEIAPIVAPGVLLDVASHRGVDAIASGQVIGSEELQACASAQGIEIEPGSVVLVRTGNGRNWHDPGTYLPGPGLDGAVSKWLASCGIVAAGADNMAWDEMGLFDEELQCHLPGHVHLLVRSGIYIIENLYLEDLAADNLWRFSFICTPLKLNGATGSPVRPIALIDA